MLIIHIVHHQLMARLHAHHASLSPFTINSAGGLHKSLDVDTITPVLSPTTPSPLGGAMLAASTSRLCSCFVRLRSCLCCHSFVEYSVSFAVWCYLVVLCQSIRVLARKALVGVLISTPPSSRGATTSHSSDYRHCLPPSFHSSGPFPIACWGQHNTCLCGRFLGSPLPVLWTSKAVPVWPASAASRSRAIFAALLGFGAELTLGCKHSLSPNLGQQWKA